MVEQRYRRHGSGQRFRPLCELAGVVSRGCSRRLQWVLSDFGADESFHRAPAKMQEHYGVEVPVERVRQVTEQHGRQAERFLRRRAPAASPKACIVLQSDGSMLPVVENAGSQVIDTPGKDGVERVGDKRRRKTLRYRECRLSLAFEAGSRTRYYGGTLGPVAESGEQLRKCADQVGWDKQTRLHAVGDGAPWIAEQVEAQFGAQGRYLVDFYHVCEYLAAAAPVCAPSDADGWLAEQQGRLKANQWRRVLTALLPHREPRAVPDEDAPVRVCYRYLRNRTHQLNYRDALEQGLPIGSGEIESAHRSVVQRRMKIAGAWWKEDNAQAMLALRICRFNGWWDEYWQQVA